MTTTPIQACEKTERSQGRKTSLTLLEKKKKRYSMSLGRNVKEKLAWWAVRQTWHTESFYNKENYPCVYVVTKPYSDSRKGCSLLLTLQGPVQQQTHTSHRSSGGDCSHTFDFNLMLGALRAGKEGEFLCLIHWIVCARNHNPVSRLPTTNIIQKVQYYSTHRFHLEAWYWDT